MTDDVDELISASYTADLRRQLAQERSARRALEEDVYRLRARLGLLEQVAAARPVPPQWVRQRLARRHAVIPVLLLTDLHLDEVVSLEATGGINRYDRRIAGLRLRAAVEQTVRVVSDLGAWRADGAVVLLGGDLVSGDIHHELEATNEATVVETVLHWSEHLAGALRLLAEEFGRLHVVAVPGNHGRRTRTPRYKRRAEDNMDWLLAWSVQRMLAADQRLTWQIPSALHADVEIGGLHVRLEHGDEARGGTGISAALAPLMLLQHRRVRQYEAAGRRLDLLVVGHWHRRLVLPGLICGGTLKGADEYGLGRGYDAEPPSQELMLVAPGHGVVANLPIWVQDRKREGW